MPTGFIYVVASAGRDFQQEHFFNVPTEWNRRLYFGPCKMFMRPCMQERDWIFGLSPSRTGPRRFLFATRIAERITFREAYMRFPDLHGPPGPIHVCPVERDGDFPMNRYDHIQGALHADSWKKDLATEPRDAFFVCEEHRGDIGRWLGPNGPKLNEQLLGILQQCAVYGRGRRLREKNDEATLSAPVRHGRLYSGLHLEMAQPEGLIKALGLGTNSGGQQ